MDKQEFRKALEEAGAIDVFGREVRMARAPVVVRDDDDASPRLQGYAAMFNRETVIGHFFKFREKIAPGAFTKTLGEADVRHLFNHDPNWILGRNKSGTLRLSEDETGLFYDVDLNMDDPQAVSVHEKVKRGDVSQSSFAFIVVREQWEEPEEGSDDLPVRTIMEARLFDTSSVTYPAYEDTTALIGSSARSTTMRELLGEDNAQFILRSIANQDFNPELAPALREVARHATELAERCEGETCSQAAEEAPAGEETRAAEEALEVGPVILTDSRWDSGNYTITIDLRNTPPTASSEVETEIEEEVDEWTERKRKLLAQYQDGKTKMARSLIE